MKSLLIVLTRRMFMNFKGFELGVAISVCTDVMAHDFEHSGLFLVID
jgi:hypothetical protein